MVSRTHIAGFSTLELLVAITIMTFTSAMVLVNFTGVHERTAVNRAGRELALAARQAQSISLAVTRADTSLGPQTALTAGLKLTAGSSGYILFVDANENGVYDSLTDGRIGEKIGSSIRDKIFEGGVLIRGINYLDSAGAVRSAAVAHMISKSPEATLRFTDVLGNPLGEILEIELATPSGRLVKKVTISISGQVSVR